MNALWFVLFSMWFFLPAGIANATPVLAKKIPLLKDLETPMDFGKTFRGKRIFGANKTWRGLIAGTGIAMLVGLAQNFVFDATGSLGYLLFLSGLMGCGALVGDAVESFFKRQAGVPTGNSWFPFDQLDYIVGALIFVYPFTHLRLSTMLIILAGYFGLHLVTVYFCYLLGIRDKPI